MAKKKTEARVEEAKPENEVRMPTREDLPKVIVAKSCHYCQHLYLTGDYFAGCGAEPNENWNAPLAHIAQAREVFAEVNMKKPFTDCPFFALRWGW